MKVLVVDDERAVRDSLRRALELEGYDVELAVDGADALHRLEANGQPDAVILDVLMPGVDGLEVCRRIRGKGNGVPVLMLTARTEVESRVAGLDAGADDYLAKPFALEELLARLRALLRRVSRGAEEILRFADLELDPNTREVRRGGEAIELTRTEFNLLELFLRNPRQVLTRSVIFERVWGYDFGFASNSLDVYIGYLRRKTEAGRPAASDPDGARRRLCAARAVTFRTRLALAAAVAVALAVVLASVIVFVVVRSELRAELDDALRDRAEEISNEPPDRVARLLFGPGPGFGGAEGYPQLVEGDGSTHRPRGGGCAAPGQ